MNQMKNKFLSLPEETRINAFNQIAEKKEFHLLQLKRIGGLHKVYL